MKKYSKSISELNEERNFLLDKVRHMVYNIRTGLKIRRVFSRVNEMNIVTVEDFTKDAAQSERNLSRMTTLLNRVKAGVSVPAVIAGGAVRDTLLGYPYNDIDFFLTDVPDDVLSRDDYAVLASEAVKDPSENWGDHDYATPLGREFGYENTPFEVRRLYDVVAGRFHLEMNNALDFVARHESLEDTINSFDHGLVKCYYDGENFHVHDEFLEILKKGRVDPQDKKTESRLKRWRSRTGDKIVIGRPPKVEKPSPTRGINLGKYYTDKSTTLQVAQWRVMPFRDGVAGIEPMPVRMVAAADLEALRDNEVHIERI